ncbi:hypothetical protein MnTg02_02718 [bacterium MnTg02]|nr:hypothetical protein MnTg02_02718 [bacterium MnTg02]
MPSNEDKCVKYRMARWHQYYSGSIDKKFIPKLEKVFRETFPHAPPNPTDFMLDLEKVSGVSLSVEHRVRLVTSCEHYLATKKGGYLPSDVEAAVECAKQAKEMVRHITKSSQKLIDEINEFSELTEAHQVYYSDIRARWQHLVLELNQNAIEDGFLLSHWTDRFGGGRGRRGDRPLNELISSLATIFKEAGGSPTVRHEMTEEKPHTLFSHFLLHICTSLPNQSFSHSPGALMKRARRELEKQRRIADFDSDK